MSEQLDGMVIPKHVAMILDGNGRWAKNAVCRVPWAIRKAA